MGLRRPVLLAGFGGWGDAGSAASIALRHVLGDPAPPASAMVDPSACYDFTVARPLSTRSPDGRHWSLEYPKVAFYPVPMPDSERDLLVLLGPEPHFRWPELAPAIIEYARAAGVESMLTLGAYVGPVSHHNAPVVRRTLDAELGARLDESGAPRPTTRGPTAFATALLHAAAAKGVPAASLWVATPPICRPATRSPRSRCSTRPPGDPVPVQVGRLREVADSFLHDVETALQEHPSSRSSSRRCSRPRPMTMTSGTSTASPGRAHWRGPDPTGHPRCPTRPAQRQSAGRSRREIPAAAQRRRAPNPARPRGLTRPRSPRSQRTLSQHQRAPAPRGRPHASV